MFNSEGQLFVADPAAGAIVEVDESGRKDIVVAAYEDRPLKVGNRCA